MSWQGGGNAAKHKIGIEKRERLDKVETLFLLQETYNLMCDPSFLDIKGIYHGGF